MQSLSEYLSNGNTLWSNCKLKQSTWETLKKNNFKISSTFYERGGINLNWVGYWNSKLLNYLLGSISSLLGKEDIACFGSNSLNRDDNAPVEFAFRRGCDARHMQLRSSASSQNTISFMRVYRVRNLKKIWSAYFVHLLPRKSATVCLSLPCGRFPVVVLSYGETHYAARASALLQYSWFILLEEFRAPQTCALRQWALATISAAFNLEKWECLELLKYVHTDSKHEFPSQPSAI